jgi:hypothetical protein
MIRWVRSVSMQMLKGSEAQEYAKSLAQYMTEHFPMKVSIFSSYVPGSGENGMPIYFFMDFESEEDYKAALKDAGGDETFMKMRKKTELDVFLDGTYKDIFLRQVT